MKLSMVLAAGALFCSMLTGSLMAADPAPTVSYKIAVIPKGTTHEYWKSIHAGAIKAQQEAAAEGIKVEIAWQGPIKEDQSTSQISVVENMVNAGVSGIVLAPNDASALAEVVDSAAGANIPVVIIDSDIKTKNFKSFVATDNMEGGRKAGEALGKLLGGKGSVMMLRYQVGSASTEKREAGFLEAIAKFPDIKVVSSDKYAGATGDEAHKNAENVLAGVKNDDGSLKVDGIFCSNESCTYGMLLALKDINATGKVKFVGFDASTALVKALAAGEIDGLVVQDPVNMGYLGVKTMLDVLANKEVQKRVDTGVQFVTKENMNDPKIADVIHPPLEKYGIK